MIATLRSITSIATLNLMIGLPPSVALRTPEGSTR
ncbi:hypothetical protein HBB04_00989 [Pseudomonas coronafaciens]|nr:hypothetical protein HBB04_00989 [Pseudomonas coronafaciens]